MQHQSDIERLAAMMCTHPRPVVLTGAGCSTESGIPDYRGSETRRRTRNPIKYQAFVTSPEARQRYWARSMIGWPRMLRTEPNGAHTTLARLEKDGVIGGVITQNVDRLHHAAGSKSVVELHGALAEVRCLSCTQIEPRIELQSRLERQNPAFVGLRSAEIAPDGDAELEGETVRAFRVVGCLHCGGILKPNVVFFGENVPGEVKEAAFGLFDSAGMLLIIGSSLAVYSGYRFIRRAQDRGIPIAVINLGPMMRGNEAAALHIDAMAGEVLPALARGIATRSRQAIRSR